VRSRAPGLALAGAAVGLALALHAAVAPIPPLVVCVALGVALRNTVGSRIVLSPAVAPGLAFASGVLLKAGVVLLGLELVFPDIIALGARALAVVVAVVAVTFFGTRWLGKRLGVSSDLSLLVATGFSICGISAIAAATGVVDADEDEVAFSVALVTLCGTLAIVILPLLHGPLGLDDEQYGAWVGASVHDVAQVVAAASTAGSVALATAIVVKLTRVLLLAPLVMLLALARRRAVPPGGQRPSPVPPFVVLFVGAVALASLGVVPEAWLRHLADLRTVLLGMALFAIGTRVDVVRLRRLGARPLALGLTSWALIAAVSYVGVLVAWR
jgi:uncharacterized integral membrane protein (TIGR00698 family)